MAVFSIAELRPAMFMDCVYLSANAPFHLEYIYRSAMLENNDGSKGLILSDNAVHLKNDLVVVSHYGLEGETQITAPMPTISLRYRDSPHEVEALARILLPEIQVFFESEERQREFAEWKAQRDTK